MADMYTTLNVTRSYVYNVARALDNGNRVPKVMSCICVFSSNSVDKIMNAAFTAFSFFISYICSFDELTAFCKLDISSDYTTDYRLHVT